MVIQSEDAQAKSDAVLHGANVSRDRSMRWSIRLVLAVGAPAFGALLTVGELTIVLSTGWRGRGVALDLERRCRPMPISSREHGAYRDAQPIRTRFVPRAFRRL